MAQKQLILVRHAQAIEAEEFKGVDFDRPLTDKGKESATIIAKYLRLSGLRPDLILASPSDRTHETAVIIAEQQKIEHIEFIDTLYNGDKRSGNKEHLKALQGVPNQIETLMLVGHNNDISEFAEFLTEESIPSMRKGSVIVVSFPEGITWNYIK